MFTFEYDQAMRNAILIKEIIQPTSKPLITLRQKASRGRLILAEGAA